MRLSNIRFCVCLLCAAAYAGMSTSLYARDTAEVQAVQEQTQEQNLGEIKDSLKTVTRSVEVLRKEVKKVRTSVSGIAKKVKQNKDTAQAVAELNLKLASQAQTVKSLSGELFRLSSRMENTANKEETEQKGMGQVYKEIDAQRMLIKDLKNEIRILREIQTDMQTQSAEPAARRPEQSFWEKAVQWKFWGHTAFGLALIALVVAL